MPAFPGFITRAGTPLPMKLSAEAYTTQYLSPK